MVTDRDDPRPLQLPQDPADRALTGPEGDHEARRGATLSRDVARRHPGELGQVRMQPGSQSAALG